MLNKVILMGRLAADPELRQTSNGVSVSSFRVAVGRTYNREQTDWIDIVAWRQQAEFVAKYFHKGNMIIVEGAIQCRNYEDKDGNKRKAVEVVADQVHFAERKRKAEPDHPASFQVGNLDEEEYEVLDADGPEFAV